MGEITLFHWAKQTKAIPQEGSHSRAAMFQHWATSPACFCGELWQPVPQLEPQKHCAFHTLMTTAIWQQKLMNPTVGVGMLLSASAMEKAQRASSLRYWSKYTGGGWFSRSKSVTEKFCPRGHFQKYNVHSRQEMELWAKSSEHEASSEDKFYPHWDQTSLPFICFCFHDTVLCLVSSPNLSGYPPWLFVFSLLPEVKHSEGRIRGSSLLDSPKCTARKHVDGKCLRTQLLPLTICVILENFLVSKPYLPHL